MPDLTVNGQPRTFAEDEFPGTVLALVASLGLAPEVLVAEVNGAIVSRDKLAGHALQPGDAVELVQLVGGG